MKRILFEKVANEEPQGMIKFLGLQNFWSTFSENEKCIINRWYISGMTNSGIAEGIDKGNIFSSTQKRLNLFISLLTWAERESE